MVSSEVIGTSLLIAFVVDIAILALLYQYERTKNLPPRALIAEDDRYPSLARLQLLIWTFVAIFAFLSVSLVRIQSGVFASVTLPANILTLIGISAGSSVASAGISRQKYKLEEEKYMKDGKETYAPLSSMLEENGTFSITRFQMLAWTFVAVIIFLATFAGILANLPSDLSTLNLPDVSQTLVTLTGISQGAYLTGKGVSK